MFYKKVEKFNFISFCFAYFCSFMFLLPTITTELKSPNPVSRYKVIVSTQWNGGIVACGPTATAQTDIIIIKILIIST